MPKLQQIQQIRAGGARVRGGATAQAFGAGVSGALVQAGEVVGQIGQAAVQREAQRTAEEDEELRLQQVRRDTVTARRVVSDFQIDQAAKLDELKRDPEALPDFHNTAIRNFDEDASKLELSFKSDTVRDLFVAQRPAIRTSIGKTAVAFEGREIVRQGIDTFNGSIASLSQLAADDIINLESYYDQARLTVSEAAATGFVTDVSGQTEKAVRAISFSVANSLLDKDPSALTAMIDDLEGLTAEDQRILKDQARARFLRLGEIAETNRLIGQSVTNGALYQQSIDGTLTFREVDECERRGQCSAEFSVFLKEGLVVPQDITREAAVRAGVEAGIISEEVNRRLGREPAAPPPTGDEKAQVEVDLIDRFLTFGVKRDDKGNVELDGEGRVKIEDAKTVMLSDLLDFQTTILAAAQGGFITSEEATGFLLDLAPVLRTQINQPKGADVRFFAGGRAERFFADDFTNDVLEVDPFSPAFSEIINYLEQPAAAPLNTPSTRNAMMRRALELARQRKALEIPDPAERRQALQSVGGDTIIEFIRKQVPALRNLPTLPNVYLSPDGATVPITPSPTGAVPDGRTQGQQILFDPVNRTFGVVLPDGTSFQLTPEEIQQMGLVPPGGP